VIGFPKPRPHALVKRETDRDWKAIDERESRKVQQRAKGRCEVIVAGRRCNRPVRRTGLLAGVHHHLGGWKLRGRGISALARNKTYSCHDCHDHITKKILEHIEGNHYRRIS
jgi:hypothetical protein